MHAVVVVSDDDTVPLARPATKQHTVSQVVLRQFTVRQEMSVYDARRQVFMRKGPRAGFNMSFDQHDPFGSEALWAATENQIPKMYASLHARSAVGDPDAEDLIRDVLALHWARSAAMKAAHERVLQEVAERSIARMSQESKLLQRGMQQATGLHASGPEGLEWFNRSVHSRLMEENREHWWSERNAHHFSEAKAIFRKWSVQVGYAEQGSDFIISDAPAVTLKPNSTGAGPHQHVALGDANEVFMPVSPTILIAVGPVRATLDLTRDTVERYNRLQLKAHVRWLGCRPDGPADRYLRKSLPIRSARGDSAR